MKKDEHFLGIQVCILFRAKNQLSSDDRRCYAFADFNGYAEIAAA